MPLHNQTPERTLLIDLLKERNQNPDRSDEIDQAIRTSFEQKVAILTLDMCGFTRLTARRGILFYLSMICEMGTAARPAIEGNRGRILKLEADNLFAVFDHPADALEAALDIFIAFKAVNSVMPDDRDIRGCIGIGYGDMIVVGTTDVFGVEMNNACKLAEDLAKADEILLTPAAAAELSTELYEFTPAIYKIGDDEMTCHRFIKRLPRELPIEDVSTP